MNLSELVKTLAEESGAFVVEPEHASIAGVSEVSFDKICDLEIFAGLIAEKILSRAVEDGIIGSDGSFYNTIAKDFAIPVNL